MPAKIHFLNVGSGDCTIIHFPKRTKGEKTIDERVMMVDIYHHEDGGDNNYEHVIDYYKRNFQNSDGIFKPIFRFILTHPHQDHLCGLKKLFEKNGISIYNFWDVENEFEPEDFSGHPTHEDDWNTYQEIKNSDSIKIIKTTRDDEPKLFWNDDEDKITILSPTKEMIRKAHFDEDGNKRKAKDIKIDEISYSLLVQINDRKIILAGDGKEDVWQDILDNCGDKIKNCHILKAGHHGQESAFHKEAVKLMNPKYIVFSNSEEEDKTNGAKTKYLNVLPNAVIYKTSEIGTIIATCPYNSNEETTFERA